MTKAQAARGGPAVGEASEHPAEKAVIETVQDRLLTSAESGNKDLQVQKSSWWEGDSASCCGLPSCPRDCQGREAQHVLSPTDRRTALGQLPVFSDTEAVLNPKEIVLNK